MYCAERYHVQRFPAEARFLLTSKLPSCDRAGRVENADYDPVSSYQFRGDRVIPPELGNSALPLARNSRVPTSGLHTPVSCRRVTPNEEVSYFNCFMETCGTVATAALTGVSGASSHFAA